MTMGSPFQKWPGLSLFLPVFCAVLIADQISKQIMLDLVFNPPRYIEIGLLLNIVPVWNSGMSFGMLADGGLAVRIGLTVLAFAVSGWFVWMLPKLDRLQRLAGAAASASSSAQLSTSKGSSPGRWAPRARLKLPEPAPRSTTGPSGSGKSRQ